MSHISYISASIDFVRFSSLLLFDFSACCSRDLLIAFLDRHCAKENQKSDGEKSESESESAFDFLYLPIDFWYMLHAFYY